MNVKIEKLNHNGEGIGRIDNKVIFVPKTVYGDIVSVRNVIDYGNYFRGEVKEFVEYSLVRDIIKCPYYDRCGGCQIMALNYESQLEYKKNKVIDIFSRYCNIKINPKIVFGKQFKYRNKVVFQVKDGKFGYFEEGSNNFVEIDRCIILSDRMNNIITVIKENLCLDNVSKIMIRDSLDKIMIVFYGDVTINDVSIFGDGVVIYVNDNKIYGSDNIVIGLDKYKFTILPESFFQVNSCVCLELYKYIKDNIILNSKVLDLYCGVGSIGIYCASKCKEVVGVEINKSAINNANINKNINNIDNISFICINANKIKYQENSFDVVIVDPPRGGLDKKTVDIIKCINSKKLIYVSCNPITLVRDVNRLSSNYKVDDVKLFDMFPNSYHVESVVLMKRSKEL